MAPEMQASISLFDSAGMVLPNALLYWGRLPSLGPSFNNGLDSDVSECSGAVGAPVLILSICVVGSIDNRAVNIVSAIPFNHCSRMQRKHEIPGGYQEVPTANLGILSPELSYVEEF